MANTTSVHARRKYFRLRAEGANISEAARESHISRTTAQRLERGVHSSQRPGASGGRTIRDARVFLAANEAQVQEPIVTTELSFEAKRALEDFAYFRRRYFGRIATPWQTDAALRTLEWLEHPDKTFAVVNCPPGSGKSTMWHDICCWLIARNRGIRILIGSRTERQARQYSDRLRRTMERVIPVKTDESLIRRGLGVDAEATMAMDFGRFKPLTHSDLWRRDEFIVCQFGQATLEDKEPTVSAYGMDSGFLGGRYDVVLWDDLVDKVTMRTVESRETQRKWWEEEAETRLEPGGVLILQGQRMGPEDLYRYALNQVRSEDDDSDEGERVAKYEHVCYRAHYEDQCLDDHTKDSKPYPEGCLLDPIRLPWRELMTISRNRAERYRVLYQQEDVDPERVLVQQVWIKGGKDEDGYEWPGCQDVDRGLCEWPKNVPGPWISVVGVDPSPTKRWGITWWAINVPTEQRFLLDVEHVIMPANAFLDWNHDLGIFTGLAEDWQARSVTLGLPIKTWIVEVNAAQRFLLAADHVNRWQSKWRVDIVPHTTSRNKADPQLGPQMLGPLYKYGKIRLPWRTAHGDPSRVQTLKLIEEVTRYPEGMTDDIVMSQWFVEYNLPHLMPRTQQAPLMRRPRWMRGAA